MATDLDALAARVFTGVMAPLVLGGPLRPGHAIGARAALKLGKALGDALENALPPPDAQLASIVSVARVRRARRLIPVDTQPAPDAADWALAAAFHDILLTANPIFDAALRRRGAARILELAILAIESVRPPAHLGEALARHTWLARVPEVTRTDAEVRWWAGSRHYRGIDPPERLQAWPRLRSVSVVRVPRPFLELTPLAVDRERLTDAVAFLLARTPLTDVASCTRAAPAFEWHPASLELIATAGGRMLALRALARLPAGDVDGVLSRATRTLFANAHGRGARPGPVLALLRDRAIADAQRRVDDEKPRTSHEITFAQAVGAILARRELATDDGPWSASARARLMTALLQSAQSPAGRDALALLERLPRTGTPDA